jgi:hypothetical protein
MIVRMPVPKGAEILRAMTADRRECDGVKKG